MNYNEMMVLKYDNKDCEECKKRKGKDRHIGDLDHKLTFLNFILFIHLQELKYYK